MKQCRFCRHGSPEMDGDAPFIMCRLIPPQPTPITEIREEDGMPILRTAWVRPAMTPYAYCGQFKLSLKRLLWDGPRASR